MPDVIVIGGGVQGCALAYYLRAEGRTVTVLERRGVGDAGSGRNTGGVRQQGRVRPEIPLAMEALEIWPQLDAELGAPTEYTRRGNLLIGGTDEQLARIESRVARQEGFDLDSRIVERRELEQLLPIVGPTAKVALYCPHDGHANPLLSTLAFAGAARRRGAEILEGTPATGLERTAYGWRVETARGPLEAEVVVNMAGPGAVDVCNWVGFSLPILNARVQTMVTEPLPPLFDQFVQDWDHKVFTRQTRSGNLLYGDLTEDYVLSDYQVFGADAVRASRKAITAFPAFADLTVIRTWGGVLDVSIDQMPIVGEAPGLPGLFVAAGSSGHGFGTAPAVGRRMAQWIASGRRPDVLEPFGMERFSATGTVDNIDDGTAT